MGHTILPLRDIIYRIVSGSWGRTHSLSPATPGYGGDAGEGVILASLSPIYIGVAGSTKHN